MKVNQKENMQMQNGLLDTVESAMRDKMKTGRASETSFGFVAQLVNATPPVKESFRRALRTRVLAELEKEDQKTMITRERAQPALRWRFALVALVATLVVGAAFLSSASLLSEFLRFFGQRGSPALELKGEDLDALTEALSRAPVPRTVLVSADHADAVADRVQHHVVPLELGDTRPSVAIRGSLGTLLPVSGFVDVIAVGQDVSGATAQVRAALEQTLYRLYRASGQVETETFGSLERSVFLAGPADAMLEPTGAVFEGGIELVAGGVLDDLQAGEHLRVALDWRIESPADVSPVVFVHLVHNGGQLVSARDAVPGNGLFPVPDWEPGDLVRDQFALSVSSDLSPGQYELQVGMYDPETGMRYSLVEPEGGTYVVVQRFNIEGTD
jgi:hypothetical protein